MRVHGELYSSPVFLEAHCALQASPKEPGCDLPHVVVAIMLWSDVTHLTTFGTAKLWPCYMYFGNESKYNRCKPSRHLCNHIAYFQSVSLLCSESRFGFSHVYLDSFRTHLRTLLPKIGVEDLRTTSWRIVAVSCFMHNGPSCLMMNS